MKTEIQLTEIELLKLENIKLKLSQIESVRAALNAEQSKIAQDVQVRLDIPDVSKYAIDLQTGIGKMMNPPVEDASKISKKASA